MIFGVNETSFLVQHELCQSKCRFNESVCNSRQKWSHDECWCDCKELHGWRSCKDDYLWNLGICDCECYKGCKIDKYLGI